MNFELAGSDRRHKGIARHPGLPGATTSPDANVLQQQRAGVSCKERCPLKRLGRQALAEASCNGIVSFLMGEVASKKDGLLTKARPLTLV